MSLQRPRKKKVVRTILIVEDLLVPPSWDATGGETSSSFRSCFRLANVQGVDKLVCELCEEEDAKKPARYSATATSRLKTHVESNHSATATAIAASTASESQASPEERKLSLPRTQFSLL